MLACKLAVLWSQAPLSAPLKILGPDHETDRTAAGKLRLLATGYSICEGTEDVSSGRFTCGARRSSGDAETCCLPLHGPRGAHEVLHRILRGDNDIESLTHRIDASCI
ncbi:hypothetical protein DFJ74DRAFT_688420 [Hyaloraphidium curvatum]|nr:hypothetical protein DFJ74DRAFT_688420 [Hyaloraphidium curvatum]